MFWCMYVLFIGTFQMASCYNHDDLDRLMSHLFNESRYNKDIRPIQNQSETLLVNATYGLYELDSLDVTAGLMTMMAYFKLSWKDEYLVWNPAEYGGISQISVSYDKIWEPGIAQKGGVKGDNSGTIINEGFSRAFVFPNGLVVLMTGGYYTTTCDIDTRYYPFDSHVCNFMFFSFRHTAYEVTLNAPLNDMVFDLYNEHSAWDITDTEAVCAKLNVEGVVLSVMRNTITVRRRPVFVFVNRYCPLLFLSILNAMTSLIPPDSGERFSYAVTMYLSFVFMTIALVDEFPQNALHISLSSYGVLVIEIFTASIVWTVLMVRMSRWKVDKTPIPKTLVKLVMWSQRERKVSPNDDESVDRNTEDWVLEDINQKTSDAQETEEIEKPNPLDEKHVTWLNVTWFLDKAYFVVMVVLVMLVMIAIIIYWLIKY